MPVSIVMTADNTILVSSNHKLYKVTVQGSSSTHFTIALFANLLTLGAHWELLYLAGSGTKGRVDGRAEECRMSYPRGLVVHEASHSLFFVDHESHTIRKVTFVNSM
jgi:hypothetical protein